MNILDIVTKTEKPLASSCDIDITTIFIQLHIAAMGNLKKVVGDKLTIINSAVKGSTESDYKFNGAGDHVIMCSPVDDTYFMDGKVTDEKFRADSLKAIQTYVQWFCGPDISKKITDYNLIKQTVDADDDMGKALGESIRYITESPDDEPTDTQDTTEQPKDDKSEGDGKDDKQTDDKQTDDKQTDDKKKDEKADTKKLSKDVSYYIIYELEIGSWKKTTLKTNIKSISKRFSGLLGKIFGDFGFEFHNGDERFKVTAKDVASLAKNVVESHKIDPDKLKSNFNDIIQKEFPDISVDSSVLDSESLLNYLNRKGVLTTESKGKLRTADYTFTIKIDKRSKAYPSINKQVIAEMVTKAIGTNWIKKFMKSSNYVTKNDVIEITNYSDNLKNPYDKRYTKKQQDDGDLSEESYIPNHSGDLLTEADINITVTDLSNKFEVELTNVLGEAPFTAKYMTNPSVIDFISKHKIKTKGLKLSKSGYSFLVDVAIDDKLKLESLDANNVSDLLLEVDENGETTDDEVYSDNELARGVNRRSPSKKLKLKKPTKKQIALDNKRKREALNSFLQQIKDNNKLIMDTKIISVKNKLLPTVANSINKVLSWVFELTGNKMSTVTKSSVLVLRYNESQLNDSQLDNSILEKHDDIYSLLFEDSSKKTDNKTSKGKSTPHLVCIVNDVDDIVNSTKPVADEEADTDTDTGSAEDAGSNKPVADEEADTDTDTGSAEDAGSNKPVADEEADTDTDTGSAEDAGSNKPVADEEADTDTGSAEDAGSKRSPPDTSGLTRAKSGTDLYAVPLPNIDFGDKEYETNPNKNK